jgi:serine/threonine protein kinase
MADPLIGKKLGDYVIQELLGKGGMARVYKGYDERLQRYAAVKVIDSELATANQIEYRMRFEREARAIAKLDQHPNIVKVYQFGEYEQVYFMAMAFIEGKDLRQILREYNERAMRMPHADVIGVVQGIGDALDYAHSLGVIHRDVKPSNIMITPHKQAVLTDFGLVLSASDGTLGDTFGSAHYIAPEQAVSSKNAVPQSDLYSLGICAYEMLTGRVPFDDPSAMSVALKHLHDMPPSPLEFAPELPSSVEAVLFKVLDKDPERRYASGAEFARALALALFGGDTEHLPIMRSAPLAPKLLSDSSASRRFTPASDWIEADDDRETLDLRLSQLAKPQALPAKKRGLPFLALIGVLFLLAALAVFFSGRPPETPAAALTETALAALPSATHTFTRTPTEILLAQPTVTLTVALTVAPSETHTPTVTRTSTATRTQTPVPIAVQHTATPTASTSRTPTRTRTPTPAPLRTVVRTPTPTHTHTPTHTFTPTLTPPSADVLLIYDDDQLNLINISRRTLNLLDLNFIQDGAEPYLFSAAEWALTGAVRQPSNFPPDWCLKVGRIERQIESRFSECRSLASFRYTAPTKQFWRSHSKEVTTFSVRLGNQEIAVCAIDAKRCTFSLPARVAQ